MTFSNGMSATELGVLEWRKSRASNPHGNCVELAGLDAGRVAVRNSRDPHGPALICGRDALAALLQGVKSGEFDDLV